MSALALILALAALTTTCCITVFIYRRLCQVEAVAAAVYETIYHIEPVLERLDDDLEDLWGVTDTLDLDQENHND